MLDVQAVFLHHTPAFRHPLRRHTPGRCSHSEDKVCTDTDAEVCAACCVGLLLRAGERWIVTLMVVATATMTVLQGIRELMRPIALTVTGGFTQVIGESLECCDNMYGQHWFCVPAFTPMMSVRLVILVM